MRTFKTPKGTELPFLNLKGKDYLLVSHRICWFREEKPDWAIITKATHFTQDFAVVEASIEDPTGRVIATANKMQTAKGFPGGYLEKAEAGAVGRALAFLGYGTAMAQELEEDENTPMNEIADSPIAPKAAPKAAPKPFIKAAPQVNPSDCTHKWLKSKFKENQEYCINCKKQRDVPTGDPREQHGNIPF